MRKNKLNSMSGFTLIEVLISVAILAIVGVAVLTALTGATKARFQTDVRTTAVSLADTTMETIKGASTTYIFANTSLVPDGALYTLPAGVTIPNNFSVYSLKNSGTQGAINNIYGLPWDLNTNALISSGTNPADPGIQKVTIIIQFNGKEIYRLIDFKVNRNS